MSKGRDFSSVKSGVSFGSAPPFAALNGKLPWSLPAGGCGVGGSVKSFCWPGSQASPFALGQPTLWGLTATVKANANTAS